MAHYVIAGGTGCGKTTLAINIFRQLRRQRKPTLVLDPMLDTRWSCDYKTDDLNQFSRWARTHKGYFLAIDEAGVNGKYNAELEWLCTKGRHLSHNIFLLTQNLTQVSPLMRDQCETIFLFSCSTTAEKLVADSYRKPELLRMPPLGRGEYYRINRFAPIEKFRLVYGSPLIYKVSLTV